MKKALLFFCLVISSASIFANTPGKDFDYFIIFGGSFDKDIVSLKINNHSIFKNYKVENRDSIIKGNLSLIQSNNKLNLQYNGNQKFSSKIIFNQVLDIEIIVNGHLNHFKADLRKGRIILFEFSPDENAREEKKLTIDQFEEPVIFI